MYLSQSTTLAHFLHENKCYLEEDDPRPCTHLLLDGGRLHIAPELRDAFLDAYHQSVHCRETVCMVELRGEDTLASLVLDVDYSKAFPVDRDDSLAMGKFVAEQVFTFYEPKDEAAASPQGAIFSMCSAGPNMHIAFPRCKLSREDAIRIVCTLPGLVFSHRSKLQGFEAATLAQLQDVFDVMVVTFNGIRMNGSRKVAQCSACSGEGCSRCRRGKVLCGEDRVYSIVGMLVLRAGKVQYSTKIANSTQREAFELTLLNAYPAEPAAAFVATPAYASHCDQQRVAKYVALVSDGRQLRRRGQLQELMGEANALGVQAALLALGYPRAPKVKEVRVYCRPGCQEEWELVLNSKWCANRGGEHKSNATVVRVDPGTGSVRQYCRCHCVSKEWLKGKVPCAEFDFPVHRIPHWEPIGHRKRPRAQEEEGGRRDGGERGNKAAAPPLSKRRAMQLAAARIVNCVPKPVDPRAMAPKLQWSNAKVNVTIQVPRTNESYSTARDRVLALGSIATVTVDLHGCPVMRNLQEEEEEAGEGGEGDERGIY